MTTQEKMGHNEAEKEAQELQGLINKDENYNQAEERLKMVEEMMQSLFKDIPTKEIKEMLEDPKETNIIIERALKAELVEREK